MDFQFFPAYNYFSIHLNSAITNLKKDDFIIYLTIKFLLSLINLDFKALTKANQSKSFLAPGIYLHCSLYFKNFYYFPRKVYLILNLHCLLNFYKVNPLEFEPIHSLNYCLNHHFL